MTTSAGLQNRAFLRLLPFPISDNGDAPLTKGKQWELETIGLDMSSGQLFCQGCFRSLSRIADTVTSEGNTNTTKVIDKEDWPQWTEQSTHVTDRQQGSVWDRTLEQLSQGPVASRRTWPVV